MFTIIYIIYIIYKIYKIKINPTTASYFIK